MTTENIAISKTAYTEIAAIGAAGIYSNPNSDYIYIAYSALIPNAGLKGHPIPPLLGDDFRRSPNETMAIWARLVDDALSDSGVVAVTMGW